MKLILGSALAVCTSVFVIIGCGNKNDNKEKGGLDFNQSHHIASNIKNTQITCNDETLKDCKIELKTSDKGESIVSAKLSVDLNENNTVSQLELHKNYQKALILNLSEDLNKEFYKSLIANLTYQYSSADKASDKTVAKVASLEYSIADVKTDDVGKTDDTKKTPQATLNKLLEAAKPILSKERADKNTANIETHKDLKKQITFEDVLKSLSDISINSLLPKSLTDNYKTLGFNFKFNADKNIVLSYKDSTLNKDCQLVFENNADQKPTKYVYTIKTVEFKTADGAVCTFK